MDFAIEFYADKKTAIFQSEAFKKDNVDVYGHVFLCKILQKIVFKYNQRPGILHITSMKKEIIENKKEHNICRGYICAAYSFRSVLLAV